VVCGRLEVEEACEMKYRIEEMDDGTHVLMRHNEVAEPNGGRPNNAELEFWFEIERLREENERLKTQLGRGTVYAKERLELTQENEDLCKENEDLCKENEQLKYDVRWLLNTSLLLLLQGDGTFKALDDIRRRV
jgi:hypothetical protein